MRNVHNEDYENTNHSLSNGRFEISKKTYVSDKLNAQVIDEMIKPNQVTIIDAPTGNGKSTAMKKIIMETAKRTNKPTLVLTNRISLREDLYKNLQDEVSGDFCTIMTYQKLLPTIAKLEYIVEMEKARDERGINPYEDTYYTVAKKGIYGDVHYMNQYGLIVCDESHYFTQDSGFNEEVGDTIKLIMKLSTPVAMLSATHNMEILKDIAEKTQRPFGMIISGASKKENVVFDTFYQSDEILIQQIAQAYKKHQKVVIFNNDKEGNENLKAKIQSQIPNIKVGTLCSIYDETYSKLSSKEDWKSLYAGKPLHSDVLISTSVISNGVTIKDDKISTIYIRSIDPTEIVQASGRLRLLEMKKNKTLRVCIPAPTKSKVERMYKDATAKITLLENVGTTLGDKPYPALQKAKEIVRLLSPIINGNRTFAEVAQAAFYSGRYDTNYDVVYNTIVSAQAILSNTHAKPSKQIQQSLTGMLLSFVGTKLKVMKFLTIYLKRLHKKQNIAMEKVEQCYDRIQHVFANAPDMATVINTIHGLLGMGELGAKSQQYTATIGQRFVEWFALTISKAAMVCTKHHVGMFAHNVYIQDRIGYACYDTNENIAQFLE